MPDPRLGILMRVSELSFPWENSAIQLFLSLWFIHMESMGFDCIMKGLLLLSHCDFFFVFECRISFFERFESLLVMVVQQLVVIWGLSWDEVNSSISNMPSCLCTPKFHFNSKNMFLFSFIPFPTLLLLLFSCSVMSNFLNPHKQKPARLLCPSLSPRACSNSFTLSQWCHPTISSSVSPFSCCP